MCQLYEVTIEEKRLRISRIIADNQKDASDAAMNGGGLLQFDRQYDARVVKVLDLGIAPDD